MINHPCSEKRATRAWVGASTRAEECVCSLFLFFAPNTRQEGTNGHPIAFRQYSVRACNTDSDMYTAARGCVSNPKARGAVCFRSARRGGGVLLSSDLVLESEKRQKGFAVLCKRKENLFRAMGDELVFFFACTHALAVRWRERKTKNKSMCAAFSRVLRCPLTLSRGGESVHANHEEGWRASERVALMKHTLSLVHLFFVRRLIIPRPLGATTP